MVARMRAWAAWLAVGLSGCATIEGPRIQSTAPERSFRSVEITFDRVWPASRGGSSIAEPPGPSEVRLASFRPGTSDAPAADSAVATAPRRRQRLMIRAPHPDGRRDWAEVSLVIESLTPDGLANSTTSGQAGGWRAWARKIEGRLPGIRWGDGVDEAWVSDVPASEIEALVLRLERSGYFDESESPKAGGWLAVELDGRLTRRAWAGSPELEALVRRVRERGQLASYVPVPEQAAPELELTAARPRGEHLATVPLATGPLATAVDSTESGGDAPPFVATSSVEPSSVALASVEPSPVAAPAVATPAVELPPVELPPGELPAIVARALPVAAEAGLARVRRLPPVWPEAIGAASAVVPVSFSQ